MRKLILIILLVLVCFNTYRLYQKVKLYDKINERPLINFTFQAIYEEPTGVANPSPSYGETTKPPIVEATTGKTKCQATSLIFPKKVS